MKILIRARTWAGEVGRTIEADADGLCTPVPVGSLAPGALYEAGGALFIDRGMRWDAPVSRLVDRAIGDLVFTNRSVWAGSAVHWTRYEVVSAPFD